MFKKKRKPDDINNQGRWQTSPFDIMENVVQRLNISDRIRLCVVCKSWSSIAMQRDIRSGPQFPWLVLTQQSSEYLDLSIPSEGKVIKLALPKRSRGWFHSSSKGWLIMVKEKGLNSKVFLLNPISGAKHKLPSLTAIPSFLGFVKEDKTPRHGEADYFLQKIALSSSDISECTVAAMFSSMELGLCRPGEKRWTILNYKIDQPLDILFSLSGKLYALVKHHKIENENGSVIARTIRLRDGYEVELKLVYDKEEEWQRFNADPRYQRFSIGVYFKNRHESYLIESTTHNEVLLIHQMKDSVTFGQYDAHKFVRTSDFVVYKIDIENGGSFLRVRSFGNEILFLAKQGSSLSFPASSFKGLEGNCIYFEANGVLQFNSSVRFATYYEALGLPTVSNESGVFYLDDGKIERSFSTDDETSRSTECGPSWFSPVVMPRVERTLSSGDGDEVELKLVCDKEKDWDSYHDDYLPEYTDENNVYHCDHMVGLGRNYYTYILESTTNNEVLLIHEFKDFFTALYMKDHGHDDYARTNDFVVYKIDPENGAPALGYKV